MTGQRKRRGLISVTLADGNGRRNEAVETNRDQAFGDPDRTVPEEIADLDVEVRALFERVRVRLGMTAGGPEVIGRYELREWIGRGGMGEVHRAHDHELNRPVAVKMIAPQPGRDVVMLRRRLQREGQLLAKLDHPNIVKVYDAGIHQDRAYVVMEWVPGATLRLLQNVGALSTEQLLDRYIEAGRGLAAAHAQGVIHRDFKPDNVLVGEDGRARVGDFGLGYLLGDSDESDESESSMQPAPAGVTADGQLLGTHGYMAPEQLRGEPSDDRADQFALCVSIWEALTGARPFVGPSVADFLAAIEAGPQGGEHIDRRLLAALRTGLSPRAERRHARVGDVVGALEELRERPARRRRRAVQWATGALVVGSLLGALWGYRVANPPCPLAEDIQDLASGTTWDAFAAEAPAETVRRFEARMAAMTVEAQRACRAGDLATQQHIGSNASVLASLIERPRDEQWHILMQWFEHDFVARASVPMSEAGYQVLNHELLPLDHAWKPDQLIAKCDELLDGEWSDIDRAVWLLRRGRVLTNIGKYDDALADFQRARHLADKHGDRQRSLDATLQLARTYLLRKQQYDVGAKELEFAFNRFAEIRSIPLFDRRWADYDELQALWLVWGLERVDAGLTLQARVVARELLFGDTETRVRTLVNLATFVESKSADGAVLIYRMALAINPDDPEALYNYGRLLANASRDPRAVRSIMSRLLADPDHDLHFGAALVLLRLAVVSNEPADIEAEQRRMTALLLSGEASRTPGQEHDAWAQVAAALITLDDLGPDFQRAYDNTSDTQRKAIDEFLATLPEPEPPNHEEQPPP